MCLTSDECGLRFVRKKGDTDMPYTIIELLPDGAAAQSGEREKGGGKRRVRDGGIKRKSGQSGCILLDVCSCGHVGSVRGSHCSPNFVADDA